MIGSSLTKAHQLPASLARWLPNIVLGLAGVALLVYRHRHADAGVQIRLPTPAAMREAIERRLLWRRRASPAVEASAAAGREAQAHAQAQANPVVPAAAPTKAKVVLVLRVPRGVAELVRLPRPTLLDAYVGKAYLRVLLLAFAGMLGIFYIGSFIDWSDNLFKGQATAAQLGQYMWYSTPQFVYYVLPLSALVGTLVTIGLLTKSSELIVMRACGVSLYRTALPLLVLGLLWSGLLFGLEESFLASANRKAAELKHLMRGGAPRTFDLLSRQWVAGRDGRIYHYTYFDPRARTLTGLEVYRFSDKPWGLAEAMQVRAASFRSGDATWLADQGWARRFSNEAVTEYRSIANQPLSFEAASYFGTEQPDADRLSFTNLRRYITALRISGFDVVSYRVALHRKIAFPFVALVMTLIAIPFAVTTGRRGALFGIGLGLLLAISYWGLSAVFGAIGGAGLLSPPLAAWAPNVLFVSAASYLLLYVRT
jgi:LPS export ABC transporter permease LptG